MNRCLAALLLILCTKGNCVEYTNGFVLQTESGQQVGFVLASPNFKVSSGECVFMLLPQEANLVDSELGIAIAEGKVTGEHQWRKQGMKIQVSTRGITSIEISENAEVLNNSGKVIGKAVPLPTKSQ